MNVWKILKIDPTPDKKAIKKAYHVMLRSVKPEEDPEGFMKLREAYESALEKAEDFFEYDEEDLDSGDEEYALDEAYDDDEEYALDEADYDDEEYAWDEEDYDEEANRRLQEYYQRAQKVDEWWQKVTQLWNADIAARWNAENWKALLYEDIPFQITYYGLCRNKIHDFIIQWTGARFLPVSVLKVLDDFFGFSMTEEERQKQPDGQKRGQCKNLNATLKLREMIDFDGFDLERTIEDPEQFCSEYVNCILALEMDEGEEIDHKILEKLKARKVFYLPFACLYVACQFGKWTEEEVKEAMDSLAEKYGDTKEVTLLSAQYLIYQKKKSKAKSLLLQLYQQAPLKDYVYLYQLAICCEKVSLLFEAYMLTKQLTYLKPMPFMYDFAQKVYKRAELSYKKKKTRTDLDHIRMCRFYLRADREMDAPKVLSLVEKPDENLWEYHIARCLCIFNGDETTEAESSLQVLEAYPKEERSSIYRLEWEELKARHLLEKKEYEKCIATCNTLLEEYPASYPVRLLRAYADWGQSKNNKRYYDVDRLVYTFPRKEPRLLTAGIFEYFNKYNWIEKTLESVKEKCPIEYLYSRIVQEKYQDFDYCVKLSENLIARAMNEELPIPPVSKHNLLDLEKVFSELVNIADGINGGVESAQFYEKLIKLTKSAYNHPDKYVDLAKLYNKMRYDKLAIEEYKKALANAPNKRHEQHLLRILVEMYGKIRDLENMEECIRLLDEGEMNSREKTMFYIRVLNGYGFAGRDFEKAKIYCDKLKERLLNPTDIYYFADFYLEKGDKKDCEEMICFIQDRMTMWGIVGDLHGDCYSIYMILSKLYEKVGRFKEAKEALENMRKYSRYEELRNKSFYRNMGELYERAGRLEEAYQYYQCIENDMETRLNIFRIKLMMKRYKEVKQDFIDYAYSFETPECAFLICALHAHYLDTGEHDLALAQEITDRLEKNLPEEIDDGIGECYGRLMELYGILGKEDLRKKYEKKFKEFQWKSEEEERDSYLLLEFWNHWYRREYKEALELIERNHPEKIFLIEIAALYYHLKHDFFPETGEA